MRYFFLVFFLLSVLIVSMAKFRGSKSELPPLEIFPDMDRQAKVKYQASSNFFSDGAGARLPVEGTLPMGYEIPEIAAHEGGIPEYGFTQGEDYYHTGRMGDYWGDGLPTELGLNKENIRAFLQRGRERYAIYCYPCHGESGNGNGIIKSFGHTTIANLLQETHLPQNNPDGKIYNTIAKGKGNMGAYGDKLTVRERWAIVAYLRVLQKSYHMPLSAVEEEFNQAMQKQEATN